MIFTSLGLLLVALGSCSSASPSPAWRRSCSASSPPSAPRLLAAAFSYYRRARSGRGRRGGRGGRRRTCCCRHDERRAAGALAGNWDLLGDDAAAALARTFGFDELQPVRAHEVAHGYRHEVLDAIDERLEDIVTTRRRVG